MRFALIRFRREDATGNDGDPGSRPSAKGKIPTRTRPELAELRPGRMTQSDASQTVAGRNDTSESSVRS